MRAIGRHDAASSRTIGHSHSASTKTEWMDHGNGVGLAPNVWLVRMPPHEAIGTHFHTQNQFQLFVEGSGRIGQRPVGAVTAHYAGAFSGYGPLVAGDEGMAYFTIRARHDPGAQHLPEARAQQVVGPRRVWTGPVLARPAVQPRIKRSERSFVHDDGHADGMRVEFCSVAPGDTLSISATGECLFACALAGEVLLGRGERLGYLDWLFLTPDEGAAVLSAGTQGAELVVLQMPLLAGEYRQATAA